MNKLTRKLGNSEIEVSAIGLGCWAIGGICYAADGVTAQGWGGIDDSNSVAAVQAAVDHGLTFFDTADVYGCGHSEKVLGQALEGRRDKVVLATKFGAQFDEESKIADGMGSSPEYIRSALEASLRRLRTDYIDLYQFHNGRFPAEDSVPVRETLEGLVSEGKIRYYGWSTDVKRNVEEFAKGDHCVAAQLRFNVFEGNAELLGYCEEAGFSVLCRSPLAMGLLTEKYNTQTQLSGEDIRNTNTKWLKWFKDGRPSAEYLKRREAAKEILTSEGRSLSQGALCWLLGKSDSLIPIPGFKNSQQAVENAGALQFGPLSDDQVKEVEDLVRFTPMNL